MYLVSIYFDNNTDKKIRQYMNRVAEVSGNQYMIEGQVPPHITISAFETKQESKVIEQLDKMAQELKRGTLQWASVGVFLPYVIFLAPVLNEYLHDLSVKVYDSIVDVEGITISRFYQPLQWMPHTTVAKKLTEEEMSVAFKVLQKSFRMFSGEVTRIGVAKTNPYQEIINWDFDL